MGAANWKQALGERIPEELGDEIDGFETQIELRRQGKLDEKVFAESRLRRGVYGQRYDNGQRHDGVESRTLNYPSGDLSKGPSTIWDETTIGSVPSQGRAAWVCCPVTVIRRKSELAMRGPDL